MSPYNIGAIVSDISEVSEAWVYKFYYRKFTGIKINQPFDGRIIKVKSVINRDSDPSLCFFYKEGKYYWKDFSSGQGGDYIKFVSYHMNKTLNVAISSICMEYEKFLGSSEENYMQDNIDEQLIVRPEYEIQTSNYFTQNHLGWWARYKINADTLIKYNVDPGIKYKITRGAKTSSFENKFYAFGNKEGYYQIYQPDMKPKYINVDTKYLIGKEQLRGKKENIKVCAILSGLKDIMAMEQLDLSIDLVAGPSESTLISKYHMEWLKSEYQFVLSMMDNDVTGAKSMLRYQRVYGIPFAHIKLGKDHADNISQRNLFDLKDIYAREINKKLNI